MYVGKQSLSLKSTVHMSKYRQYLKQKYKLLSLSSPNEILECTSSKFVNLYLTSFEEKSKAQQDNFVSSNLNSILENPTQDIERSITCNKSLTVADILNIRNGNKVILIEGGPGMGKSTLAINICKCWADNELLQQYDAVILLPLCDPEIQAASNVGDLLLVTNENEQKALYDEIFASEGDKVCFILEGYDELPDQLRKAPVFAKLKEKLPKCTVIYTSRPEACNHLRSFASHRIEIRGFKEEKIDEYIIKAFENVENGKEKAEKLTAQVMNNPSIRSILYVPINIAILCHLFLLTLTLPTTLTELYTLLCLNLILRHINKNSPGEISFLDSLDDLPAGVSKSFFDLCLIAFRGRMDDKIIFSSREIKGYGIDPNKLSGLGLLLVDPSTSVYGREKSYYFLHLILQEYCAAFYISRLPDKEQEHCFIKYRFNESFQMIWRMYSGITRLRNEVIFHHMLPSKWVKSYYRKKRVIELLSFVYEAHNDEVCSAIINHLNGSIDLSRCKLDRISCAAVGYLLEKCRENLKFVDFSFCTISDEDCNVLINSLLSPYENFCPSNCGLNLFGNYFTDKCSPVIASLLSSNYPITILNVANNHLSSSTDIIFKSLYHNDKLTELWLRNTSLTSSDMQSLGQMLASNCTLTVLDVSGNDIKAANFTDWRNISINKLMIEDCKLGVDGADKVGKMLYSNKSITSVDLGRNSIGDKGVEKLVEHLKSNNSIKHLNLQYNDITSDGANHLRKLFSTNHTTVDSIDLSYNLLKDQGVDCILQSISTVMEYVGLSYTGISSSCSSLRTALHQIKSISFTPPDNCYAISYSLADTTVLEELELNNGSDTANHEMISGINRNNSIKKLRFRRGQLRFQTLTDLVRAIKINKIITELCLYKDVSSSDCLVLADMLTVNTSIKEVTIWSSYDKQLDQSLASLFLNQLKNNYTLEVLTLGVTYEARDDDQFVRDVETLVEDINNIRQSHGVTTPLLCKVEVVIR